MSYARIAAVGTVFSIALSVTNTASATRVVSLGKVSISSTTIGAILPASDGDICLHGGFAGIGTTFAGSEGPSMPCAITFPGGTFRALGYVGVSKPPGVPTTFNASIDSVFPAPGAATRVEEHAEGTVTAFGALLGQISVHEAEASVSKFGGFALAGARAIAEAKDPIFFIPFENRLDLEVKFDAELTTNDGENAEFFVAGAFGRGEVPGENILGEWSLDDQIANGESINLSEASLFQGEVPVNPEETYWLTSSVVTLAELASADFDNDGTVSQVDLAIWQDGYGIDDSGSADFDDDSDGQDFLIWQRQTASVAASEPVAVPEPVSAYLLLLGCLLLLTAEWTRYSSIVEICPEEWNSGQEQRQLDAV